MKTPIGARLGFLRMYSVVLEDQRNRLAFMLVLFFSLSALDLLSIGLIGPFIGAILDPTLLNRSVRLHDFLVGVSGESVHRQITVLGVVLASMFLLKSFFAYFVQRRIFSFGFHFRTHLVKKLMRAYLNMPYRFYLERNTASIVESVISHTKTLADDLFLPSLRFISDGLVLMLLGAFLIWMSPLGFLMLALMLGLTLGLYVQLVKPRVRRAGKEVSITNERIISGVNEGMGGIKEIRILRAERSFFNGIAQAAEACATAQTSFYSLLSIPRYLMETVLVVFVVAFSLFMLYLGESRAQFISILAIFGAAGMRILPAMTSISSSVASMQYSSYSLTAVYTDLAELDVYGGTQSGGDAERATVAGDEFARLDLHGVSYRYANAGHPAVDDISFAIERGQAIGLIGESGSGKTTLVDILLGLHPVEPGSLRVNGVDIADYGWSQWRDQIAYIPQNIFLVDDSLAQNVAFGVPGNEIDMVRVKESLDAAQLTAYVQRLPKGLQTDLGERGVRLSGGERQRVALARAFYHNRSIFIFDEATSALDIDTEQQVIDIIKRLHGKKTMIVIAHRLTTVKHCDVIHRLHRGRIVASGLYTEVVGE